MFDGLRCVFICDTSLMPRFIDNEYEHGFMSWYVVFVEV